MKFSELQVGDLFRVFENKVTLRKSEEDDEHNAFNDVMTYNINDNQEVTKLNNYRVAGEYTCVFEVEVYAESLEDAIDIIGNDDGKYVKVGKNYLDDSFLVDKQLTKSLNNSVFAMALGLDPDFE